VSEIADEVVEYFSAENKRLIRLLCRIVITLLKVCCCWDLWTYIY